jgi:hypothetical protein
VLAVLARRTPSGVTSRPPSPYGRRAP